MHKGVYCMVQFEPGGNTVGIAVRQEIDWALAFQVDQNGATEIWIDF